MNTLKHFSLFTILVLSVSCTNNSPDDLIDKTQIVSDVTYQNSVKIIIENNCLGCHGAIPTSGSPMSLTTYANVKQAVLARGLIERTKLQQGNGLLMPQGGPKLPQNQIDILDKWLTQNLQE